MGDVLDLDGRHEEVQLHSFLRRPIETATVATVAASVAVSMRAASVAMLFVVARATPDGRPLASTTTPRP